MKPAGALLLMLACGLRAQFDTAAVLGTVRDATGGVVAGARVTLTNLSTAIAAAAQTDENGNYTFFNIKIGS